MRRPENIDLDRAKHAPSASITSPRSFQLDLPSPRVGEIPPALSPLDAFAQQSRMLAKRFEESQQLGKRLSRLDHIEVANQLGKKTQTYARSPLDELDSEHLHDDDFNADLPLLPRAGPPTPRQQAIEESRPAATWSGQNDPRPVSQYPQFGFGGPTPDDTKTPRDTRSHPDGYFGFQGRRAVSPEPLDVPTNAVRTRPDASPRVPSLTGSMDSVRSSTARTNTDESQSGLAPPGSRSATQFPRSPRSNVSIRSVLNSADDEYGQRTTNLQELAPPRKFSNGSAFSGRRSPMAPQLGHTPRSPSNMSEHSADSEYRRPSFNFSRPMSGGSAKQFSEGRPSLSSRPSQDSNLSSFEFPARRTSVDKARSPLRHQSGTDRGEPQQIQEISTPMLDSLSAGGANSYIYSKFLLPRGRGVGRVEDAQDMSMQHGFHPAAINPTQDLPSPADFARSAIDDRGRPFAQAFDLHKARSRSVDGQAPPTPKAINFHKSQASSPSVTSANTDRTLDALHVKNSASEEIVNMTPEQHLEEGIQCHNSGSLSKSTYHLRLAAKSGLPAAMLLYALACRHGWGMRANQQEGIVWLKKAVDSAGIDLVSSEKSMTRLADSTASPIDDKQEAKFALAVYELGISYMNGWGIPKDKALALRCFEIAGNWGDCDALAEAGFCYTQGVGCKKDLKKAARYYRKAAEGGMSMAGNSWIYKEKYNESPPPSAGAGAGAGVGVGVGAGTRVEAQSGASGTGQQTGRSRGKSLFGRKNKSVAT